MTAQHVSTGDTANSLNHYVVYRDVTKISSIGFGLVHIGRLMTLLAEDGPDIDNDILKGLGMAVKAMGAQIAWNQTMDDLMEVYGPVKPESSEVEA